MKSEKDSIVSSLKRVDDRIEQLEKEEGVVWTQDGWFVNDSGVLMHFRNKCLSELKNLEDINKNIEIKEKTLHYTYLDNIRGWIAIVLSILSFFISIWAFYRTF